MMPYMMQANGSNFDVYKQGTDKKPTGKALNSKPMNKVQAQKYMDAMYANEGKSMSDAELISLEEKCGMDSYYGSYVPRLNQTDPRVAYDPLAGRAGNQACANCRWFQAQNASCALVYDDIVATGLCDLWLSDAQPAMPAMEADPMPVYLVAAPDDTGVGAMGKDMYSDPENWAYVPDKNTPSKWKLKIGDAEHARLALAALSSNPPHGNKVDIPAADLPGVRKKVEQAIRKFVTDKEEVKKLLGGKSLVEQFIDFLGIKEKEDIIEGFKVLSDGRWRAWYSNNARDLVNENFSAKSIDAYISRVDKGVVPYPELWFKHLPVRMGKADALARIGYMTFATGKFYDTPLGQKARAYYEAEQKAGRPKTNSHGFLYPVNMKENGVYNAYNTFEISVLDPGEEANPYTLFEVKTMFASLSKDKLAELETIFGKDEVQKLVNFGEMKSRELENTPGVDLKSFSTFDDIQLQDKQAHEMVKALAGLTEQGLKIMNDRLDKIDQSIKGVEKVATDAKAESEKAVADLRSYVEQQFGQTPRASKSAQTQISAKDPQVLHQQKANEEAGTKTDPGIVPADDGAKSIFGYILEAAGVKSEV